MASLKDVAQYAGVSASTVSRVLSHKSYVNEKTREKVMAAVRVLNYTPNALAQGLKMGRSDTIAMMVPNIQNLMFPDIVRGVEDTARESGYTVILCNTDEDLEVEKAYIGDLRTRWVGGLIIASMTSKSTHIQKLREEGFPVVLTSRSYTREIDAVIIDNQRAGFEAANYLIRTGHRTIAFVRGRKELSIYADRYKGYCQALERHGIAYDDSLVIDETNRSGSLYHLIQQMLARGIRPDAILASNDPRAFVVMRALHDMGLSIPEDISVMGIDNVEISAIIQPPLSTVAQPLYEIGVLAAKKLIHQIQYKEKHGRLKPPQVDVMRTDLIIRKSTR